MIFKNLSLLKLFGLGKQQEYFVENLSMLLSSGVSIDIALEAMRSEHSSWRLNSLINKLQSEIQNGSSIWKAFESTGVFPSHAVSLIRIGEESERLSENLVILARETEKSRELGSKIKSAMMYPVFVFSVMIAIAIATAWFTLPRLAVVLGQMKVELPIYTRVLMDFGVFLKNYGLTLVPAVLLGFFLVVYFIFGFSKTKFIGQVMLFHFPIISKIIQEVEISKMGYLLGTLLSAGIPVTDALSSLAQGTTNFSYRRFYIFLKKNIEDGNSFKKSFRMKRGSNKFVPFSVQQIIFAAEQSGSLAPTLVKIGSMYEEKVSIASKNLATVIEPILLVVVAVAVLFFAMAVILPIYSLVGGLGNFTSGAKTTSTTPSDVAPAVSALVQQATAPENPLNVNKTLVITQVVNVRSGPSTKGVIITKAKKGEQYTYFAEKDGWYNITLADGKTGWVIGDYVQLAQPATIPGAAALPSSTSAISEKMLTTTENVNVRSGPATIDSVVAKAKKGDQYSYFDEKDGWYNITLADGKTGWVIGKYVQIAQAAAIPAPSAAVAPLPLSGKTLTMTSVVNVRSEPSTKGSVVEKTKKGDQLNYLDEKDGWYNVTLADGKTGWVIGKYVQLNTK